MILENIPVLTANVPNLNGHIYPIETVANILAEYHSKEIPGMIGMPNLSNHTLENVQELEVDISEIVFMSKLKCIKDGQMLADIKVLNTPKGILFKDALLSGNIKENSFRTDGIATVGKCALDMSKVMITDLKLCQINYVENPA